MFHFDENPVYALRCRWQKKKKNTIALDTRFGRNNAAAKRPGMKNCLTERSQVPL